MSVWLIVLAFGLMHSAVDLASVSTTLHLSAMSPGQTVLGWHPILLYNTLAFVGQWPCGILTDWLQIPRSGVVIGLLGCLAGELVLVSKETWTPTATILLAGLGNALFHAAAGGLTLSLAKGRAGPNGIFVSFGALGLGAGVWLGRSSLELFTHGRSIIMCAFAFAIMAAAFVTPRQYASPIVTIAHIKQQQRPVNLFKRYIALMLLLLAIGARSYLDFSACDTCEQGLLVAVGVPLAVWGGKLAGGVLCDQFGWLVTGCFSFMLSSVILVVSWGDVWPTLVGLFFFQIATPSLLTAVYLVMPTAPGAAKGLPSALTLIGALPILLGGPRAASSRLEPLVFVVLCAAASVAYVVATLLIRQLEMVPAPRASLETKKTQ